MNYQSKTIPSQFNKNNCEFTLTRYAKIEHILEFVKNRKLHFSPLSSFPDLMEGKTFNQAKFDEDGSSISPQTRRGVLYASCWYAGNENLNMWDIYGNKNKANERLAIQFDLKKFKSLILEKGLYRFIPNELIENDKEFKLNTFKYGLINYIDFENNSLTKKEFIGRFKSSDFEHEHEFRFLISQNYINNARVKLSDLKCCFNKVSFDKIKFTIIVSPYASKDYFEFVKKGFKDDKNVEVIPSKLTKYFK